MRVHARNMPKQAVRGDYSIARLSRGIDPVARHFLLVGGFPGPVDAINVGTDFVIYGWYHDPTITDPANDTISRWRR